MDPNSTIGGQINTWNSFKIVEFGKGSHPVGQEPPKHAVGHNLCKLFHHEKPHHHDINWKNSSPAAHSSSHNKEESWVRV